MDYNFVNALYEEAVFLKDPSQLQQLKDLAKAQIFEGLGTQLLNTTINGKTMGFKICKPADELYVCAGRALNMYYNGPRSSLGFDFSGLMF